MIPDWLQPWIPRFEAEVRRAGLDSDPAHDLEHVRRVVRQALRIGHLEGADPAIVLPAAYLHDIVNVPKNDPRRSQASRLAADHAIEFLVRENFPDENLSAIRSAIESHSYSAGMPTQSLEAEVLQDADRLDGLGAIGVARCFAVGGAIGRRFYDPEDPFAEARTPDDLVNTLDHFYVKLFKIVDTLRTAAGREEGERRLEFMRHFIDQFRREVLVEEPDA